jgi:hypothetical protein
LVVDGATQSIPAASDQWLTLRTTVSQTDSNDINSLLKNILVVHLLANDLQSK